MSASTITWTSGAAGDWTAGGDWIGGVEPSADDDAVIGSPSGADATIESGDTVAINDIALSFGGNLAVAGTLALGGILTTDNGQALTVSASGDIGGGTIDVESGGMALLGTLDGMTLAGSLDTAEVEIGGVITTGLTVLASLDALGGDFVGAQTLDAGSIGNATITLDGALTIAAGATFTGTFDAIGGTSGNGTLINDGVINAATSFLPGAALVNNGTILAGGFYTGGETAGAVPLTNAGTLTLAAGAYFGFLPDSATDSVLTNSGLLHIVAGSTFELLAGDLPGLVNSNAGGTIEIDTTGELIVGALLVGGVLDATDGTIDGDGTLQDATIEGSAIIAGNLNVAGTFGGAIPGSFASADVDFNLTLDPAASIADVALTLEGGDDGGLVGEAGLTLGAGSSVVFVKGPNYQVETSITAATSLTLAGALGAFADGTVVLTATSGSILNSGTILTGAGEILELVAQQGSFVDTGSLQAAAGSALILETNVSVTSLNALIALGAAVALDGTLDGGGGTVTLPAASSFAAGFGSLLQDVTIDAEGTIGMLATTFDNVAWVGVPLDVSNAGVDEVEDGLVVREAGGGAGTLVIGGTNTVLNMLDAETLDNLAIDIGSNAEDPGSDSITVLNSTGALTLGGGAVVEIGGNTAFNGIDASTLTNDGVINIVAQAVDGNESLLASGISSGSESNYLDTPSLSNTGRLQMLGQGYVTGSEVSPGGTSDATVVDKFEILGAALLTFWKFFPYYPGTPNGNAQLATSSSAPGISAATLAANEATITGSGTIVIGNVDLLDAGIASSQHLEFDGPGALLALAEPGDVAAPITGFGVGNGLDLMLDGYIGGTVSYTGGDLIVPTAAGDVSLAVAFAGGASAADVVLVDDTQGGTLAYVACFAAGTRIATEGTAVMVERLRVGDRVRTAEGRLAPVAWLGHRRVDCRRHPRPDDVQPVCVRAHAFGRNQPETDLRLSPDHAVFVAGALIPVRHLVNGATVVREAAASVTYWHVELDRHDVLLAQGLPCESFLDTGNRAAFVEHTGALALHADFAVRVWEARGCAPLVRDGPALAVARRGLLRRAGRLGHALTGNPGVRVRVRGRELRPRTGDGRHWHVRLPEAVERVHLISRVWVPAQTTPGADDTRRLGVAISRLWLDRREVSLDSPGLASGWHAPEAGWRWTDGVAELALAGVQELAFEVAMTGTYWQAQSAREVHAA